MTMTKQIEYFNKWYERNKERIRLKRKQLRELGEDYYSRNRDVINERRRNRNKLKKNLVVFNEEDNSNDSNNS